MSKYTTGELAKLCGVSVRTVQYYDSRNILVPSELSEGGRRLYSEDDLKRMRVICFLREAGLSINSIGELFADENPDKIISILLDEQKKLVLMEMEESRKQLDILETIEKEMKSIESFSIDSIIDIASIMKNKDKLRKLHLIILVTGLPVSIFQWASIILWIVKGTWWLFPIWLFTAVIYAIFFCRFYFARVAYICPECHEVFKPSLKEAFFAMHTPKTRKLTCPKCGRKGLCVEIYSYKGGKDSEQA